MKSNPSHRIVAKKATIEKRKYQICKVYTLKFDGSKLSLPKRKYLNLLFTEAKWLYNNIVASKDIFKYDYKVKQVTVFNKDRELEERILKNLSSQMRQTIVDRTKQNIINLSKSKKKVHRIGKLKFKSRIQCIPLKQFGVTYRLSQDNKYVSLQGYKNHFKISGRNQIPENAEFANANLVKEASGFYLKVTCFLPLEKRIITNKSVGIDFGIQTSLTLSNGEKINVRVPISESIKQNQRLLFKKKKGSKNYYKQKDKLNLSWEKHNNIKKDLKNKAVSHIVKDFDTICAQDENIKGWHSGLFGKQVQESCLGGIMSDLKKKSHTFKQVPRFVPTTKGCNVCGCINKINDLSQRIYVCDACGHTEDRDIHSAKLILRVGAGRAESTPVETISSIVPNASLVRQDWSMKQEANGFSRW